MKLYILQLTLILAGLFVGLSTYAQQAPSQATNIGMNTDERTKRLVITYDLPSVHPGDSLYVEIETASGKKLRPKSVSGHVGKAISAGTNRTIYWDVVRDNIKIDEEVDVIIHIVRAVPPPVTVARAKPPVPVPAPAVSVEKKSPLPIIGWIATGGLAAYSFVLASSLSKDVDAYNQNKVANTLAEWNTAEAKRKDIDSRRSTITLVAGAAAVLLVVNIVYMIARKSHSNSATLRPEPPRTAWHIQPSSHSVGIGLVRTF